MSVITFSEYAWGTVNPVYTFSDNVVSTIGLITGDGAQPNSPVIAANYNYFGPIFAYFLNPVSSVTMDVGYFDNLGSTRVEFRDASGNLLYSVKNAQYGVQTFSFSSEIGIASIAAIDEAYDASGFSLDSLVFGAAVDSLTPPVVALAASKTAERDLGTLSAKTYSVVDALGTGDSFDTYKITVESAGTATVTSYLLDNPGKTSSYTIKLKEGVNVIKVVPGETYAGTEKYRLDITVSLDKSEKDKAIDEFIDDFAATMIKNVVFDLNKFKYELLEQVVKKIDNADDAAKLLSKIGKAFGWAGTLLDVANRIDNIHAAADVQKQLFVEIVDLSVGLAGTGLVTAGVTVVGTPIAGVIGGFATGLIYDHLVSDAVKDAAGDWYAVNVNQMQAALKNSIAEKAGGVIDLAGITLDTDYYLATYADARAAVYNGAASSAMMHFLTVGLEKGYKPNADAAPLSPDDVVFDVEGLTAAAGYASAVFEVAAGELAGDKLSVKEKAVADHVNDLRSDGTEVSLSAQLTVLANRLARDWVLNNDQDADQAFDVSDLTGWAETVSTGESFRTAFADVSGLDLLLGSNVEVIAAFSEEQYAKLIYQDLIGTALAANQLLGVDTRSIGIGEFGGLWIVLADTSANANDAAVDKAVVTTNIVGDDDFDTLLAGTGKAKILGMGGADIIKGGSYGDYLDGGDGDDRLEGGAGNDVLIGGAGKDQMIGGRGNDTYHLSDRRGVIVEEAGQGADTVVTSVSYTLARNLETLKMTGASAISGNGNALSNLLKGNGASNKLNGLAGNDKLYGGRGNDTLAGGTGKDKLYGEAGNDKLYGGSQNDVLSGGAGDDILVGGTGADDLYGGSGRDVFVFNSVRDSTATAAGRDSILDLSASDRIDLRLIDANSKVAGNQSFTFVGENGFSGVAGELRIERKSSDTFVYGDVNGDRKTDFALHIDDPVELTKGYFYL